MSETRTRVGAMFFAAVVVFSLLVAGGPVAGTDVDADLDRTDSMQGTTQDTISVGLVGASYLGEIESTLSDELSSEYTFEEVTSASAVENYDVIVVETLAPVDTSTFYDKTNTEDIGVIYLDQWGNQANSIPEIAPYYDSIGTVWQNDESEGNAVPPVSFEVKQSHPILDGFSEGEDILIHEGGYADHSWFEQSGLDVLATVKHDAGAGGPALAVQEETNTVFAASLGYTDYAPKSVYTADAATILGNAVEYVAPDSAPPEFVIDSTTVPGDGEPGETVTVEATVSNQGGQSGDATVTFEVGGQSVDQTVTIDAGATTTVTMDVTLPDSEGTYDWTLSTGDDQTTGTIEVVNTQPATFTIDNVSMPAKADTGETVSVDIDVTNVGDEYGEKEVAFTFAGEEVGSKVFGLDAGESMVVTTEVTVPSDAGSYDWRATAGNDEMTGTLEAVSSAPAAFAIDSVAIPAEADPGATVTVDIEVTNIGDEYGEKDVAFEFAGQEIGGNTFGLEGGETTTITTDVTMPEDPGTYEWRAIAGNNESTGTLDVVGSEPDPANFTVTNVNAPSEGNPGQTVTVEATIENVGGQSGEKTVTLTVGGQTIEQTVNLNAGASQTVGFDVVLPSEEGNYDWTVSTADDQAAGTIDVAAEPGPAEFDIVDVTAPSEGEPGETVTVEATISNVGEQADSQTVTLEVGDRTVETTISLGAGATTTVTLDIVLPSEEKDYAWTVSTNDNQATGSIEVVGNDPAQFTVESVDAPAAANTSEAITVEATISNVGDRTDEQTVTFQIDGQTVEQTVSLDGGETTTLTFDVTAPNEEGTYDWTVSTTNDLASGTIDITDAPAPAEFTVESVDAPSTANTSEAITVEATISNTGEQADEQTVSFQIDGQTVEQTVSLERNATTTLTFDVTAPDAEGGYDWTLSTADDQATDTLEVGDPSGEFTIKDADGPDKGGLDETVTIETTIENVGDVDDEVTVNLWLSGDIIVTKTVGIAAGQSKTLDLDIVLPEEADSYNWTIAAGGEQVTEMIQVVDQSEPPEFTFESVDMPGETDPGEDITLTTTVSNVGGERATKDVEVTVAGETVSVEDVALESGETETLEFDVAVPDEEGSYDWSVTVNGTERSGELDVVGEKDPIQVDIGEGDLEPGETTSVRLTSIGENIAGYDVTLTFDPDVVEAVNVDAGDIDGLTVDIDNEAGTVDISAGQETGLTDPLLAVVEFEAVTAEEVSTTLSASSSTFLDGDAEILPAEIEDGSVTINRSAECRPGDVNGDGEVNVGDATLMQRYIAGYEPAAEFNPDCGDLDGDGEVTTADVVKLLNKIVNVD